MTLAQLNLRSIWEKALVLFLVVCPVFVHQGFYAGAATLRIGQEQFFQFGATVLCGIFLVQNLYLGAFLTLCAFLFANSGFVAHGGAVVLNVLFFSLLYAVFYRILSLRAFGDWVEAIKWLVVLNIALMALQAVQFDPVYRHALKLTENTDLVGVMGIKAFSGIFMSLMLPFFRRNMLVSLMLLFPIWLSQSSCAIVAACFVIGYTLYQRYKKTFVLSVIGLALVAGFFLKADLNRNMFFDRFNLWRTAISDTLKNPILGYGMDTFRRATPDKPFIYFKDVRDNSIWRFGYNAQEKVFVPPKGFTTDNRMDPWDHPHNELVSLFFEFGFVGLFVIGSFMFDIVRRFRETRNVLGIHTTPVFLFFCALFINSMGHFPFHVARIAFIVPLMLAFFYKITDTERMLNGTA